MINIYEAKTQLSRLIREVQAGGQVIIGRAGRPVAVLSAYRGDLSPRSLGGWKDRDVWMSEDFDEPLPEDVLSTFEA